MKWIQWYEVNEVSNTTLDKLGSASFINRIIINHYLILTRQKHLFLQSDKKLISKIAKSYLEEPCFRISVVKSVVKCTYSKKVPVVQNHCAYICEVNILSAAVVLRYQTNMVSIEQLWCIPIISWPMGVNSCVVKSPLIKVLNLFNFQIARKGTQVSQRKDDRSWMF